VSGEAGLEAREALWWLERSKDAVASRQAAVPESYEKARFNNLQNWRKKQKEANGILDKRTIQAALGKCQPRQRMWGMSGKIVLGVCIEFQAGKHLAMIEFLRTLPTIEEVVYLSGIENGLSLWFSGPRQAGDFITHWSSTVYPTERTPLHPLLPPEQYVPICPDNMLSVREEYMAGEGMDTYSVCPACQSESLHVLSTTATRQKFGNPRRAIRYFCVHCQLVCNEPAVALCRSAQSLIKSRR
jgi:hypothetical protein